MTPARPWLRGGKPAAPDGSASASPPADVLPFPRPTPGLNPGAKAAPRRGDEAIALMTRVVIDRWRPGVVVGRGLAGPMLYDVRLDSGGIERNVEGPRVARDPDPRTDS